MMKPQSNISYIELKNQKNRPVFFHSKIFQVLVIVTLFFFFALVIDVWCRNAVEELKIDYLTRIRKVSIDPSSCPLKPEDRFDCLPRGPYNEQACSQRGCCWSVSGLLPKGVPICFYPLKYNSYINVNQSEESGVWTSLMQRKIKSPYPKDVDTLSFQGCHESENRFHVKITDAKSPRYESPYPVRPKSECVTGSSFKIQIQDGHTGFKIIRTDTNTVLFDAEGLGGFTYSNQFLQLTGKLPDGSKLFGIGQQQGPFLIDTSQFRTYTLWNHDVAPRDNVNLYGSHPFVLIRESSAKYHGLFLLNSNGMDIITQPGPSITFRTIGGILDLYWFSGNSPGEVTRNYLELIGKPMMPPYWALGFHLCRFGYGTLKRTIEVWNQTRQAGIPFDVQWNDLDYMNKSNDFSYNKEKFAELPGFVKHLHEINMKYVPLIDPGISAGETPGSYPPYDNGLHLDIFVKDDKGKPFLGKVWNSVSTVWPDFSNPKTYPYWTENVNNFHAIVPIDGAWIDMNEPSNFYNGKKDGCPKNSLNNPPYIPNVDGGQLYYKTLCPSAKHYAGLHYDLHNVYGYMEAAMTKGAMTAVRDGNRSLVITRSTFPGSGVFAGAWTGDVFSTWFDMKRSIPQILNFNMFGIPFVGADICGFNGNTTVELCARWMQLGSFYPFSRNHNTDDGIDQDPVSLGEVVVTAARTALNVRYTVLPYLYSLFYRAERFGETVARPLFFEFPEDENTTGIDDQFLLGACLHVVPVLDEGKTEVNAYLPQGVWYDWYSNESYTAQNPKTQVLKAPLDKIPVLARGGCIIPTQLPKSTTVESRETDLTVRVYLGLNKTATGIFFWDDGENTNGVIDQRYFSLNLTSDGGSVNGSVDVAGYTNVPKLDQVIIFGVCSSVTEAKINGKLVNEFKWDARTCRLNVDRLQTSVLNGFSFTWK